MKRPPPKPLWGFGWMGWCLLTVALALASMMVVGVDIRFWILTQITWVFGINSTYWFVSSFTISHALFDFPFLPVISRWNSQPPAMRFSLITMCLTLIALRIHPRRMGVVQVAAIVGLGVIGPGLTMDAMGWLRPFFGSVIRTGTKYASTITVFSFLWAGICALALTWFTRSVRMGLVSAAILLAGAWLFSEHERGLGRTSPLLVPLTGHESWYVWLSWVWNPALFGCLLTWAIPARRRVFPEYACQGCGYDLRGSQDRVCPECGVAPVHEPRVVEQDF